MNNGEEARCAGSAAVPQIAWPSTILTNWKGEMANSDPLEELVVSAMQAGMPPPIPVGGVTPDMTLSTDLGLDSVGLMGICFLIDQQIPGELFDFAEELTEATTVIDIIRVARKASQ